MWLPAWAGWASACGEAKVELISLHLLHCLGASQKPLVLRVLQYYPEGQGASGEVPLSLPWAFIFWELVS